MCAATLSVYLLQLHIGSQTTWCPINKTCPIFLFLYHIYTFQIKASDFGKKVRFKVRLHAGIHMKEII